MRECFLANENFSKFCNPIYWEQPSSKLMSHNTFIGTKTTLWLLRRCGFLLQRKGQDFVDRVKSMFPNLPRPLLRGVPATSDDKLIGGDGIAQKYFKPPSDPINRHVSMMHFTAKEIWFHTFDIFVHIWFICTMGLKPHIYPKSFVLTSDFWYVFFSEVKIHTLQYQF